MTLQSMGVAQRQNRFEGLDPRTGQSKPASVDERLVALVFILAAAILVVRTLVGRSGLPFFADTDDAMRMVMVRDFLAGQNWFDLTAHRLNTPFGAELHWSRLIDLPLAALVWVFGLAMGDDTALLAAGTVWPMLLLFVLLWVSARLALRLVGPDGVLPALILPVLSPAILAEFTPGRVDHHSVVILLSIAMVWTSIEAMARPRFAIAAGLLTATALAIATEALPAVAAAIIVFGFAFVFDACRATAMRSFGLAFGLGSLGHLLLFRAPPRWLEPACDVISPVYVGVALLVAGVFTLPTLLPLQTHSVVRRLAVLAVPGGLGLVGLALVYPQCLSGPYAALDPWLQANWIAGIVEAKPWLSNLQDMPSYAIAVGLPALLACLVVLCRLWRVRDGRTEWAVLLVFLVATALVMLVQVRGARLSIMPAIPAASWLIVQARGRYLAKANLGNVAALLGSWLAFSGIVLALAVGGVLAALPGRAQHMASSGQGSAESCLVPSAFVELARLPAQPVMSPVDLGAHIMLYTPHGVVAAPYHRNQQGVLDAFRFLNEPEETAREILSKRGIKLVVICPSMPEMIGIPDHAENSLVSLLARGKLPRWLREQSASGSTLRIYAVVP